jgi:hypothetical protein
LSLTLFKSYCRIYDDHVWLGIIVGSTSTVEGTLRHVEELVLVVLELTAEGKLKQLVLHEPLFDPIVKQQ